MKRTDEILEDFDLLAQDGVIGCYNSCEITEIFGYWDDEAHNIYTLLCFEYSAEPLKDNFENLTDKLLVCKMNTKKASIGIRRARVSIGNARDVLEKLSETGKLSVCSDEESNMGNIEMQTKEYVSSDEAQVLNHILKNNFYCGSYIIEAFDDSKEYVKGFIDSPQDLNHLSELISGIIPPLDIAAVSDRLGNVIFQFPVNIISTKIEGCGEDSGLNFSVCYHPYYMGEKINLSCSAAVLEDGVQLDYAQWEMRPEESIHHLDINTNGTIECCVYNATKEIFLMRQRLNFIERIYLNQCIINPQNRIFHEGSDEKSKLVKVEISSIEKRQIRGKKETDNISKWKQMRIYDQQLRTLETKGQFRQFFQHEEEAAINNIRNLISKYSDRGVYLWDPYASAEDIKNTLYYVPYSNVPVRVIRAFKGTKDNNIEKQKSDFKAELSIDPSEYTLIDLEVRACCYGYGQKFHDRFLIFPRERAKVWSLGTSVNSQGKAHHVVAEVQNAQHILDAFEQMWQELDNEKCIIWRSWES